MLNETIHWKYNFCHWLVSMYMALLSWNFASPFSGVLICFSPIFLRARKALINDQYVWIHVWNLFNVCQLWTWYIVFIERDILFLKRCLVAKKDEVLLRYRIKLVFGDSRATRINSSIYLSDTITSFSLLPLLSL